MRYSVGAHNARGWRSNKQVAPSKEDTFIRKRCWISSAAPAADNSDPLSPEALSAQRHTGRTCRKPAILTVFLNAPGRDLPSDRGLYRAGYGGCASRLTTPANPSRTAGAGKSGGPDSIPQRIRRPLGRTSPRVFSDPSFGNSTKGRTACRAVLGVVWILANRRAPRAAAMHCARSQAPFGWRFYNQIIFQWASHSCRDRMKCPSSEVSNGTVPLFVSPAPDRHASCDMEVTNSMRRGRRIRLISSTSTS